MKKEKIFSLLLAGMMIGQNCLGGYEVLADSPPPMVGPEELSDKGTAPPNPDSVIPNPNQYRYQKDELAAFCHFGPNTFNNIEWGESYGNQKPNEIFRLEQDFDEDTFVKSIKDAGFKKLIVTAKHHDGFCIWASEHTKYDISETAYKDGKGDILEELSAACSKYGIDMGLYLSPWDINNESYGYKRADGTPLVREIEENGVKKSVPIEGLEWADVFAQDEKDYNEYYNNQLIEILSNEKYGRDGHFNEVWMDGAKGSGAGYQEYDFNKWFKTIQQYEGVAANFDADCMLFGAEAYTTVRWIGNENGFANEETWSKSIVDTTKNTIDSNKQGAFTIGHENGNQWTVPECDARITSGWFWGNTKNVPKSTADLGNMYFNSVGHNAPLLLNIPPNDKGTVDTPILTRLAEFGKNIQDTFADNMAAKATVSATNVRGKDIAYQGRNLLDGNDNTYWTTDDGVTQGSVLLDMGETKTFDVVSIEEAIQFGQRIREFKVEYRDGNEGDWKLFAQGTTIGAKRLCRGRAVKGSQIKITVTTGGAVPMLSEAGVYKATLDFEATGGEPAGMQVLDVKDSQFKLSDGWNEENHSQYVNGTNVWAKHGATAEVQFTGSKIYLIGTLDKNHGKALVTVDGVPMEINTTADKRSVGQIIFASEDLPHGEHTLTLQVTDPEKAVGIEAAYVINNGELGMIGIEQAEYQMNEDSEMEMKLVRVGGSKGKATVTVSPNPGSAIQDDFDTEGTVTVTFEDGETEKNVVVITKRNTNPTGNQYFTEELTSTTENLILGFNSKAKITIIDQEGHPAELPSTKLPTTAYKEKTATSEETEKEQQGIGNAFDDNPNTFWHANWANGQLSQNPDGISVEIGLDKVRELGKLTYLPRLEPKDSGTIGKYVIEAAKQPTKEGEPIVWEPVCEGSFTAQGDSKEPQSVVFPKAVTTNRIRLTAKSMAGGNHPTAAEFALYETAAPSFYKVTTKAHEGGSIVPVTGTMEADGTFNVQEGKMKTFKIVPNKGYEIVDVKVNNVSVGAVNRFTVKEAATIEAIFQNPQQTAADYSKVDAALNKIPADLSIYTEESVAALKAAEAAVVRGYDVSRQAEVDAMATALETAIAGLQKKGDANKKDLQKHYDEYSKAHQQAAYTPESWKAYAAALANAKAVLDKKDATQQEVDAALVQLKEAAKNLIKKSNDPQTPPAAQGPSKGQSTPLTGDGSATGLLLAAALSAGAAVITRRKSKSHTL